MLRELATSCLSIGPTLTIVITHLKTTYRTSEEHRYVRGQLRRSKKQVSIRGLNKDHNHDLKGLFKAAATRASVQPGPFQDFYQRSLAKGIKPTMVRLTLARKIAAITLTLWKKGENFDAEKLKSQAA